MTSAAHVRLTQADIEEATHEELIEDEYGYSLSKLPSVAFFYFLFIGTLSILVSLFSLVYNSVCLLFLL